MSEKQQVNLGNARHESQLEVMKGIIDDGVCPFCIESLRKYHKQPIIREGQFWIVTTNQWPYPNTKVHNLLIARQHVETITELPPGAFEELGEHMKTLVTENNMEHGGIAMRFGEATQTGATVRHLHAHLIQSEENLPNDKKVRFKFSG